MIKLKDILNEEASKIFNQSLISKIENSIKKISGVTDVEYTEHRFSDGGGGFKWVWTSGRGMKSGVAGLSLNRDGKHTCTVKSYYGGMGYATSSPIYGHQGKKVGKEVKGVNSWRDLDDTIVVPLKTAKQRLVGNKFPGNKIRSMTIKVRNSDLVPQTEIDIDRVMRKQHKLSVNANPDFVVRNFAQFLNARQESANVMSILLATVAAISLIVGGIGIMNIMLVTVTERTKEIGICMSIGAKKSDILYQFLIESLLISLIGGVIGVIVGLGLIYGISGYFNWKMNIDIGSIILAFSFSSIIGIVFGFYPARKASNLNPIDALRYE